MLSICTDLCVWIQNKVNACVCQAVFLCVCVCVCVCVSARTRARAHVLSCSQHGVSFSRQAIMKVFAEKQNGMKAITNQYHGLDCFLLTRRKKKEEEEDYFLFKWLGARWVRKIR